MLWFQDRLITCSFADRLCFKFLAVFQDAFLTFCWKSLCLEKYDIYPASRVVSLCQVLFLADFGLKQEIVESFERPTKLCSTANKCCFVQVLVVFFTFHINTPALRAARMPFCLQVCRAFHLSLQVCRDPGSLYGHWSVFVGLLSGDNSMCVCILLYRPCMHTWCFIVTVSV